jgi:serine/threonine protein kinase
VALKLLPPGSDPAAAARLQREFGALRSLRHPNIVRALDAGIEDGIAWLSMEFVEGMPLREWLTVATPLEPDAREAASEGVDLDVLFDEPDSGALLAAARARRLMHATDLDVALSGDEQAEQNRPERLYALCESAAQICDGLSFIHARGLVHRDLKPRNIVVTPAHRAILVDFGLVATLHDERVTDPGRAVGTYRYMSPEQARGEAVDARSDLYSLGATLYELVTGRPPFAENNQLRLLEAIVSQAPVPVARVNPGAPATLASLCDRLLAKEPADRPDSAADVAFALRAAARSVALH